MEEDCGKDRKVFTQWPIVVALLFEPFSHESYLEGTNPANTHTHWENFQKREKKVFTHCSVSVAQMIEQFIMILILRVQIQIPLTVVEIPEKIEKVFTQWPIVVAQLLEQLVLILS